MGRQRDLRRHPRTERREGRCPAPLRASVPQVAAYEVILVDGGSHDDTVRIARTWPGIQVLCAPRGRASQMNAGARAARGEWLLFLHADTLLPDGALALLNALETHAGLPRRRFPPPFLRRRLAPAVDLPAGQPALRPHRHHLRRPGHVRAARPVLGAGRVSGHPDAGRRHVLRSTGAHHPPAPARRGSRDRCAQVHPDGSLAQPGVVWLAILLAYELHLPIPARSFFSDVR